MYSPKIHKDLIPHLYRWRCELRIPMTRLVNAILATAIHDHLIPKPSCICPECSHAPVVHVDLYDPIPADLDPDRSDSGNCRRRIVPKADPQGDPR